ncbi:MAG TPA: hypothetical protein PKE69_03860 [Pyrinomonadaceae bacterium]|nr:hypothetical protein [Pyrinomonadaceae bacterium]
MKKRFEFRRKVASFLRNSNPSTVRQSFARRSPKFKIGGLSKLKNY